MNCSRLVFMSTNIRTSIFGHSALNRLIEMALRICIFYLVGKLFMADSVIR